MVFQVWFLLKERKRDEEHLLATTMLGSVSQHI
jgi:hypothetical protein